MQSQEVTFNQKLIEGKNLWVANYLLSQTILVKKKKNDGIGWSLLNVLEHLGKKMAS